MTNAITKAAILGAVIHGLQPLAAPHATAGKATRPAQAAGRGRRRAMNSTPARPPRRTLRRQTRTLPAHVAQRQALSELERARLPATIDDAALEALFASVWRTGQTAAWTVSDLVELGLVRPDQARRTGRALADLVAAGGRLGPWTLHRADLGGKVLREGRLWHLSRRW